MLRLHKKTENRDNKHLYQYEKCRRKIKTKEVEEETLPAHSE